MYQIDMHIFSLSFIALAGFIPGVSAFSISNFVSQTFNAQLKKEKLILQNLPFLIFFSLLFVYSFGWLLPRSALEKFGKLDHWRVFTSRFNFEFQTLIKSGGLQDYMELLNLGIWSVFTSLCNLNLVSLNMNLKNSYTWKNRYKTDTKDKYNSKTARLWKIKTKNSFRTLNF